MESWGRSSFWLRKAVNCFSHASCSPGGGSGLGLAIAKGFVEANGGRLRAQSLPGQGATFVIEFPAPEQATATSEV